jgi:hypothetical protein
VRALPGTCACCRTAAPCCMSSLRPRRARLTRRAGCLSYLRCWTTCGSRRACVGEALQHIPSRGTCVTVPQHATGVRLRHAHADEVRAHQVRCCARFGAGAACAPRCAPTPLRRRVVVNAHTPARLSGHATQHALTHARTLCGPDNRSSSGARAAAARDLLPARALRSGLSPRGAPPVCCGLPAAALICWVLVTHSCGGHLPCAFTADAPLSVCARQHVGTVGTLRTSRCARSTLTRFSARFYFSRTQVQAWACRLVRVRVVNIHASSCAAVRAFVVSCERKRAICSQSAWLRLRLKFCMPPGDADACARAKSRGVPRPRRAPGCV